MLPYKAAQMGIDESKAGARAPMAEQPALDMFGLQGLPQKGIRLQIDHAQGQAKLVGQFLALYRDVISLCPYFVVG